MYSKFGINFFYKILNCSKPVQKPATQLELDHQRLIKQEQSLRKDMGKKRVKQLKMANEDEDKTIHKLEKLLKIDKNRSKKGIPKMFNDGLDYALEMCLPENIEKMYAAAKEAADADQESDSEWQEDFALATGELESKPDAKSVKKSNTEQTKLKEAAKKAADQKRAGRLREIESKYFGESADELDTDLSEVDSEFERSDIEEENSDNDESDGSGDAPEEISTVTKSSKKRQLEKSKAVKKPQKDYIGEVSDSENEFSEDSENEFDDDSEMGSFDEDSDGEPAEKVPKIPNEKNVQNQKNAKDKKNQKNKSASDSESDFDVGDEEDSDQSGDSETKGEKSDIWEDIYGRTRDKDGNVIKEDTQINTGKYIPPHLRARMAAEAAAGSADVEMDPKRKEKLMQLKRLLKGQLNRLSEANMHKICTEIDNLYMRNSRNDMNTALAALICDALISPVLAPERMVMEHALLIAALHANVGTEVGANLLENLVDRFHQMLRNGIDQYDVEDKTLDNVIYILCHMYTFKVSVPVHFYMNIKKFLM